MKKNQFDKTLAENPELSFLVITDSFLTESGVNYRELRHWISLQSFFLCKVIFTPTNQEILKSFITDNGGNLSEYGSNIKNVYSINTKTTQYLASYNAEDRLENHPFKDDLIVIALIKCSFFPSDYIVINNLEEQIKNLNISNQQGKYINSKTGRNLVRVLAVNLRKYNITSNYEADESYYNLYRFKSIFPEYQLAWSVVCSSEVHLDRQQSILHGLSQRLQFSCMTMDALEHASLREPVNSTQDRVLYNLTYLVLLITGSFDSLAWLCDEIYNLSFDRKKIVLKLEGGNSKFLKAIESKNQLLGQHLLNNQTQERIKLFYPMRDSFIHREFLIGSRIMSSGFNGNGFEILPETKRQIESLNDFSEERWGIIEGFNGNHVDGYRFAHALFSEFQNLVNDILRTMDWESEVRKRNPEKAEEIIESAESSKTALWKFLNLGKEPMYF